MSDQDQETYRLTLLGLLQVQLGDEVGREIYDALELYCRRNSCGMAIDDGHLRFVEMAPIE